MKPICAVSNLEDLEVRVIGIVAPDDATVVLAGRTYSTQAGLARLLGVTPRTLSRWDERRIGPPKIKIGKLVLYDVAKLHRWLESHERAAIGDSKRPGQRP